MSKARRSYGPKRQGMSAQDVLAFAIISVCGVLVISVVAGGCCAAAYHMAHCSQGVCF